MSNSASLDGSLDMASLPKPVQDKLEKLRKYEARFPELAKAYKQLAKEKKAVENIIRDVTTLEGLSDMDAFEAHLRSLKARSEVCHGRGMMGLL